MIESNGLTRLLATWEVVLNSPCELCLDRSAAFERQDCFEVVAAGSALSIGPTWKPSADFDGLSFVGIVRGSRA